MAEKFGKAHKHVLESIESLDIPEDFRSANFSAFLIERPMPGGRGVRTYPAYHLTRDGFALLVMGFTGKKAMEWKVRYIQSFNWMEAELRHRAEERLRFQAEQARLEMEKVKRLHTPAGTPVGFMTVRDLLEANGLINDVKPNQVALWWYGWKQWTGG